MKKLFAILAVASVMTACDNAGGDKPATTDSPKMEAPKMDSPKMEAPKMDSPKMEAPKMDSPKMAAPKMEAKSK